jgi:uncharacterized membrane protein
VETKHAGTKMFTRIGYNKQDYSSSNGKIEIQIKGKERLRIFSTFQPLLNSFSTFASYIFYPRMTSTLLALLCLDELQWRLSTSRSSCSQTPQIHPIKLRLEIIYIIK